MTSAITSISAITAPPAGVINATGQPIPVYGRSIGMDLGFGPSVAPADVVGVVPRAGWLQYAGTPAWGPTALTDDLGTVLTATAEALGVARNDAGVSPDDGSANWKLFDRVVTIAKDPATTQIVLTGMVYAKYDVIIILGTNAGAAASPSTVSVTDGVSTKWSRDNPAGKWQGGFFEVMATIEADAQAHENYVLFSGLTDADKTFEMSSPGSVSNSVAGMQILERLD